VTLGFYTAINHYSVYVHWKNKRHSADYFCRGLRMQRKTRDIGFDALDTGLKNARWLETLGYLNIQLGHTIGMGSEIGF
jgi:hypothetical protein